MRTAAITIAVALLATTLLGACIAEGMGDEETRAIGQPLEKVNPPKNTALYTSNGEATMYQWAARNAPVLRVLPEQAVVRVGTTQAKNGYYQVVHAGTWGWIHGADMLERHEQPRELSQRRLEALRLAQSAMGFSYWWSNARWQTSGPTILPADNTGDCDGNCPKCTHTATGDVEYGADCSGFISTIWDLPDADPDTNPTNNGFATKAYAKSNTRWETIEVQDALTGDAVVRHDDRRKHIFMVGAAMDEMGRIPSYECVGCKAGCRAQAQLDKNLAKWTAIRRAGWPGH